MKKRSRIIKQILALGLIFLLSINSFAAIVSDNDGSAFITKQEFEALQSSFNSQIDSYNKSIDRKIDGAIASYLAGVKTNIWSNESIDTYAIQYPLKIYAKSPYSTSNTDAEPNFGRCWTPAYCFYVSTVWATFKDYQAMNYNPMAESYTKVKNFYNGEKVTNGSTTYFKVKEQLNNFTAKYTAFTETFKFQRRTERAIDAYAMMYAIFYGSNTGSSTVASASDATGWWGYSDTGIKKYDTNNLITDGIASLYYKTAPAAADPTFTWDTANRRWNKDADTFKWMQIENPFTDAQWDVNYKNSKITEIMGNVSASCYAPVAYNGVVKFTNVAEAANKNIAPAVSNRWMKMDPWRTDNRYFRLNLISIPDWGILDYDSAKAKNSSTVLTDKWDTSLLNASDLRYDIKDTVTGAISEQTMSNGIYLFTANKNYDVKCTIKATWPAGIATLFFSKQPITWYNPTSANNLLIDDGRKYKQLTSGVATEINFKVNANDKIYYKIYCPASDVIFEEPTLMTMVTE